MARSTTRRELLGSLAALGTGAALAGSRLTAQTPGGATRRIDVHHHFANAELIKLMADKKTSGWQTWTPYSPAKAIEDMDQGGVQASMLSITTPGIWFGAAEETRRLARELNEYGARIVSDHPGRFGLFAVLPFPNATLCLKEIEYAFDTLKADGVGLLSSYADKWHGDAAFAEVFRELNRRKAIVYTHAQVPDCCQSLVTGIGDITVEYNTDTARTIISLIESGRALETPDIRYIYSHAGGTILALTGRFLGREATRANLAKQADPQSKLGQLRRFYYDTAGSTNPIQMTALRQLIGMSQILFGTDFPFGRSAAIAAGLEESGVFNAAELKLIDRGNAVKLLNKFA
ncbi:MAG TPA: amidohydrolase family protein [Bryobacteraceae bacterium]|nr:amidohydrolase family protein [Bryobacteraceae bacterium]